MCVKVVRWKAYMCLGNVTYCIIWIVCFCSCTGNHTRTCTRLLLPSYRTHFRMKKWSFAAVPVRLSCPPPGSQGPLELLLMILVSGFRTSLHFASPAPLLHCSYITLQLKEASVGLLHCIARTWGLRPAVKAHPQRERKPPLLPLQWPLHLVPLAHHLQTLCALCNLTLFLCR